MTEGAVHQGFVLRVSEFAYTDLNEILAQVADQDNPLLLILDGLTDPHNLGSILRTADATQVAGSHHSQAPCCWGDPNCRQDLNWSSGTCPHCSGDQP